MQEFVLEKLMGREKARGYEVIQYTGFSFGYRSDNGGRHHIKPRGWYRRGRSVGTWTDDYARRQLLSEPFVNRGLGLPLWYIKLYCKYLSKETP